MGEYGSTLSYGLVGDKRELYVSTSGLKQLQYNGNPTKLPWSVTQL